LVVVVVAVDLAPLAHQPERTFEAAGYGEAFEVVEAAVVVQEHFAVVVHVFPVREDLQAKEAVPSRSSAEVAVVQDKEVEVRGLGLHLVEDHYCL
jgi:hypothetical protein